MPVKNGNADVGEITSGCLSPTLGYPIAMAYVPLADAVPGREISLAQRGRVFPAKVVPMPFVPHRYVRKAAS